METYSNILLTLALGGLAVSGLLFASALLYPYLRSAWDKATALARAVFCGAVVVACLFGGAKHTGSITYPKTDTDVAYLTDSGSYVTNDAVHVAFTRIIVPDTATFYLDYCALDGTNSAGVATNWVNAKTATFADLTVPFDFAFAAATNYNWLAYTDWTPGPAVQTNGVWHAYWGIDRKQGRYFIPVRTCVRDGGSVIATPKSKWDYENSEPYFYAKYAPDSAWEIAAADAQSYTVSSLAWTNGTASADKWIDWGDGMRNSGVDKSVSHTYAKAGKYRVSLSCAATSFIACNNQLVTRVFRFGDNIENLGGAFDSCNLLTADFLPRWPKGISKMANAFIRCSNLEAEVPAWSACEKLEIINGAFYSCYKLRGKIPKWPPNVKMFRDCYGNCTSLTGAWTDDPDELMPSGIEAYWRDYTVSGASAALRALFYSDWGGTRTKTE